MLPLLQPGATGMAHSPNASSRRCSTACGWGFCCVGRCVCWLSTGHGLKGGRDTGGCVCSGQCRGEQEKAKGIPQQASLTQGGEHSFRSSRFFVTCGVQVGDAPVPSDGGPGGDVNTVRMLVMSALHATQLSWNDTMARCAEQCDQLNSRCVVAASVASHTSV